VRESEAEGPKSDSSAGWGTFGGQSLAFDAFWTARSELSRHCRAMSRDNPQVAVTVTHGVEAVSR